MSGRSARVLHAHRHTGQTNAHLARVEQFLASAQQRRGRWLRLLLARRSRGHGCCFCLKGELLSCSAMVACKQCAPRRAVAGALEKALELGTHSVLAGARARRQRARTPHKPNLQPMQNPSIRSDTRSAIAPAARQTQSRSRCAASCCAATAAHTRRRRAHPRHTNTTLLASTNAAAASLLSRARRPHRRPQPNPRPTPTRRARSRPTRPPTSSTTPSSSAAAWAASRPPPSCSRRARPRWWCSKSMSCPAAARRTTSAPATPLTSARA